jgi:hypothetical protein
VYILRKSKENLSGERKALAVKGKCERILVKKDN